MQCSKNGQFLMVGWKNGLFSVFRVDSSGLILEVECELGSEVNGVVLSGDGSQLCVFPKRTDLAQIFLTSDWNISDSNDLDVISTLLEETADICHLPDDNEDLDCLRKTVLL